MISSIIVSLTGIASAQTKVATTNDIITLINKDANPREALVQWYYHIADLYQTVQRQASGSLASQKLAIIHDNLRSILDTKKDQTSSGSDFSDVTTKYWSGVTSKDTLLDKPCSSRQQLVDDRSYALDLPTPLVMATWLMESGCGWYRPSNGDGIFQIVSKDYGTGAISTGHRIWMMYDFNDFLHAKFARYHKANAITTGFPMSYTKMSYDDIVHFGALYNGLSGATVKGNIMPAAANYVFGKLNDTYSGAVKDGLMVRVMKAIRSY